MSTSTASEVNLSNLLTIEECHQVLWKATGNKETQIESYEIRKLGGDIAGFLGEHLKLLIKSANSEYEFFVKSLPVFNEQKRRFIEKSGIFKKEADLYPLLEKFDDFGFQWKPKCYLTRSDLIVLEDLGKNGYKTLPERIEYSQGQVQLVLRSLAALHSSSLLYEEKFQKNIGCEYESCLFEVSALANNSWFLTGLKCLVSIALEGYKDELDLNKLIEEEFLVKLLEVTQHVADVPDEFKKVFCHRDSWNKNILFNEKNDNAIIIDFQISRYLPPAADLMMATGMLQRKATRDKDFKENLLFYYESVREFTGTALDIEKVLPLNQLEVTCTYFKRLSLVLKGIFLTMTHLPQGVMDTIHSDANTYHNFITVDRAPVILKWIKEDECLSSWMLETVQELLEDSFGDQFKGKSLHFK